MASGKKGKKTKGKTIPLTDFLQDSPGLLQTQPIRKSTNWADEVDEYDGYESRKVNVVLPTAPKASRDVEDIIDKVPKEGPYIAYLSNLPYDVDEEEIEEFFKNMRIAHMRIPKEESMGEAPRLKGFGYVEFEDRDSLLAALVLPDTTLKNRRIRIEVAANSENDRRRGRMDMGRDRSVDTSGDWRSGPRVESADERRGGGGSGFSRDGTSREFNRDGMREPGSGGGSFSREGMRDRPEREFTREGMRDRPEREFTREGMRDRPEREFTREGMRDRPEREFTREGMGQPREGWNRDREGYGRDREGFGRDREGFGRDRDREGFGRDRDRDGYGRGEERSSGAWRDSDRPGRDYNREPERDGGGSRQRPKLQLAPRTKPLEVSSSTTEASAPAASIFGNAKPVDTSQREREIEEKLKEQQDKLGNKDVKEGRDGSFDRSRMSRRPYDSPTRERRESPHDSRDNSHSRDNSRPSRDGETNDRRDGSGTRGENASRDRETPKEEQPRDKSKEDDRKVATPTKNEQKSPDVKRDKPKREVEMPKLQEPEPPNFAAGNKFAFLQTEDEDNSD